MAVKSRSFVTPPSGLAASRLLTRRAEGRSAPDGLDTPSP